MTRACALLLVSLSVAAPATQQPPARDAVLAPTTGNATVSGLVVDDDNPAQPVRRAIVVLAGEGLRPSRGAITDDDGRFVFTGVPHGQFTLSVSRASFITSMYGAKRPGRPGTAITVTEGARLTDLRIKLWRGAILAGTLRDETGEPVAGIEVVAIPARPAVAGTLRDDRGEPVQGIEVVAIPARAAGSLLTLTNNGALTNELGAFRIFGLEPGTYVVAARPASGGSSPYLAMSDAETDAAFEALRRRTTNQPGVPAPPLPASAPPSQQRPFDYAPIYFPGTAVIGQAQQFMLAAGQAQLGLVFSLQRVSTALVTGVVSRPDGSPAGGASLQLTAVVPPGPFTGSSKLELNATAAADGAFRIAQVTPGDYQLVARAPVDPNAPGTRVGYIGPPSTPQLFAVADLSVSGADISGLAMSVAPGDSVTGRFVFESASQKPPANLTGLRVTLIPESVLPLVSGRGSPANALRLPEPVQTRPDGTFAFGGVAPGRYQLIIGASADFASWQLKSATAGSRDVLDGLIEIVPGNSSTLVVTYDDRPTSLSGKLETASGAPASDVFVIAFAADRTLWGPFTRRIKTVRPGVDGSFAFQGLPAGDYHLSAITDADPEDWQNPAFLEQLISVSVRIRLIGGQPLVQGLRIGG